jgi:hypothetical protein
VRGFLLQKSIALSRQKSAAAQRKEAMEQIWSFYPQDKPLLAGHRDWGFPNDDELRWLLEQGVSESALWPISGATVRFNGGTFDLDHEGERALTFRAEDRSEVIDLIAWQPRTGVVASWRGQAFCLGDLDSILNPATYFAGDALRVHATPLDWLLSEREGIMIVRPDLAPAYLANCRRIRCSSQAYARQVEDWLKPHKPTVEILVEVEERAAA